MPSSNFNMSDVFISYSRRDKPFVERLDAQFKREGQETWVDWNDIPEGADWWKEIQGGIEGANTFVFIISPDSVVSDVCHQEIDYAIKNHKRFVPVVYREISHAQADGNMHPAISSHNWLFMRENDNFQQAFARLKEVLSTDLGHVRMHTRILVRGRDWDFHGRKNGYLLAGDELDEAEDWLQASEGKQPRPTELQTQYLFASRARQQTIQRRFFLGIAGALIISLILTVLSVFLFFEAQDSEESAKSNLQQAQNIQALFLADLSRQQLNGNNIEVALALAQESLVNLNNGIFHVDSERALWNALNASGQENAHFAHNDDVQGALWNGDETRLLTYTNSETAYLWSSDGALLANLSHDSSVRGAVWSPDSSYFLTWTNADAVNLWTADGTLQTQLIHDDRVTGAMWRDDSTQIITWSADATIRVWDTSGMQLGTATHENTVSDVIWSSNRTQLISWSTDRTVRLWDASAGSDPVLMTIVSHEESARIRDVQVNHDGTRFLTLGGDDTARIWDTTGTQLTSFVHTDTISGGLWDNDGSHIVTWDDNGQVMLWDASLTGDIASPMITLLHDDRVLGARWKSDGTQLLTWSADTFISIWDTSQLWNGIVPELPILDFSQLATGVKWNSDESLILSWSPNETATIWDAVTGQSLTTFPHDDAIVGATWNIAETQVLTWSADNTARIWQADGNIQWRLDESLAMPNATSQPTLIGDGTVASPDGASSLVITNNEASVTTSAGTFPLDSKEFVDGATWSPSGTLIATWGVDTVEIWRTDGTLVESLAPKGEIFGVVWHDNEDRILFWVDDNTVQVWDIDSAELIYQFNHPSQVLWADWNSDHSRINVWLTADTARVWIVNIPTLLGFAETRYLTDLNNDQREEFFLPLLEPTTTPSP